MQKWYNQTTASMENTWIKCKSTLLPCIAMLLLHSCADTHQGDATHKVPLSAKPAYEVHTVEIKDMKFIPDSLVVKKGDEVIFVNRDMVNHCITEENTKAWTSGPLPAGESYLLKPEQSTTYYCAIHTVMKGRIIVQ